MQPTHARIEQIDDTADETQSAPVPSTTTFSPVKPSVSRNFLVMDTHLETPPAGVSSASYDVPFRTSRTNLASSSSATNFTADFLSPFRSLQAVPDDIRALLPEECRQAFDGAREKEDTWFSRWGDEADVMARREPVVDKAIVPYSRAVA